MKYFVLLAALLSSPSFAIVEDLKPSGSGQLSWLFWDIYQATLYTPNGQYSEEIYPKALEINYQRDIEAAELIRATQEEWQRLKVPYRAEWLQQLAQLWPNIKKGDRLTMRATSKDSAVFSYNGTTVGHIDGEGFAKAFLTIWLSPETRDKQLRAQLIGGNNA
jgi:hypothetical protein